LKSNGISTGLHYRLPVHLQNYREMGLQKWQPGRHPAGRQPDPVAPDILGHSYRTAGAVAGEIESRVAVATEFSVSTESVRRTVEVAPA
jgi:hypothetical protein